MPTESTSDLIEYLQDETHTDCCAATSSRCTASQPNAANALRVPLELEGAIWSAVVDRIADRSIELIVDQAAAAHLAAMQASAQRDAAIHFQPNNGAMRQAIGSITRIDHLTDQRLRLNFELA